MVDNEKMLLETKALCTYYPLPKKFFWQEQKYLKACQDIYLQLPRGKIIALLGESGCGKSTLGHTLAGLLPWQSGELFFEGQALKHQDLFKPELRRQIQLIFQDPHSALNPRQHIMDILGQPLRFHGLASKQQLEEQVAALLEQVGLSPQLMHQYAHTLSGGQKQRVNIARAISLRPQLIIADEILASLDVSVQAQMVHLLMDLKNKYALTYLFISHDLAMVQSMADIVLVMYAGRIVEAGASGEIFSRPRHPYTRALLEAIPSLTGKRPQVLAGDVPHLGNLPKGCAFQSRCALKEDRCLGEIPRVQGFGSACVQEKRME